MKFLMTYEVGEVRKDQDLACHCYYIELREARTTDIYLVEGPNTHNELAKQRGELAEDLISIPLADRNHEHTV